MSSDFEWDTADTVIPAQPRTAIYTNTDGHVVVRQYCWLDDDDLVIISPPNAIAVALAILRAAGHDDIELIRNCGGGYEDIGPHEPSPRQFVEQLKSARPDIDLDRANADFDKFAALTAPKDPTAAERKRRQRERERDTRDATPLAPVTSVTAAVTSRPAPLDSWLLNEGAKETALTR
ncbi:hypothetical protein QCM77_44745 [Bradyrhizobium sp. SSUT18]|uniref:hypothetical protein n=1 Tax=Bradyrhizobium sp. SSUT18 TaxID=3040602 RepID=UPI0024476CE2|nr:hypothetical protein [Bradyrhizobium sp. SSUT18]MDH2406890.1 hypothetical protein [Bradyrhizobium sp. SSUT18]